MTSTILGGSRGQDWLIKAATGWFWTAVVGQLAFVAFILAYFGSRLVQANLPGINDKPLITGYVTGDLAGNAMFVAHVLLAAVVTAGGLAQLVPAIRRRVPAFHRWNGRIFLLVACFLGLGGLWLVWVRGTQLSFVSALATSINAVLIVIFAALAWRYARARDFAAHRRFALRAFVVVSGVWFLRIGIMGWVLINQGPRGMNQTLSGPADIAIVFGSYLIPLAVLELYFLARRSQRTATAVAGIAAVGASTVFTAVGVFGAIAFMWLPEL